MAHCRIEPGAELCCDVHCMAFKGLSLWSAVLHKRFYESASSLSYIPVHRRACRAFHMGLQNKKLERLYAKKGGCDEYFELLEKYLLRQNKDKGHGLLKLAAVYISEKRFENCFLTLDRIAFDKLTPSDQNKYFELLLYGRLMSGDISQANEIFVSAEHYFKRGLLDKRNGQMLFTIGLLEYFNERFEAAVKFFDSAEKSRDADKTLRCNCELYKGECFLAQGDVRSAKASAEKSAALVSDDKQEAQLGKLMTQVEKAYIRTKEKSADTKADNTTEGGYAF